MGVLDILMQMENYDPSIKIEDQRVDESILDKILAIFGAGGSSKQMLLSVPPPTPVDTTGNRYGMTMPVSRGGRLYNYMAVPHFDKRKDYFVPWDVTEGLRGN